MKKQTTRPDGANTPALPSRRAFFGTAAAVASVAAVPALASVSPTSAPSTAEPSDFALALAAFIPLAAEYTRISAVASAADEPREPLRRRFAEANSSVGLAEQEAFKRHLLAFMDAEHVAAPPAMNRATHKATESDLREIQAAIDATIQRARERARRAVETDPAILALKEELREARAALDQFDEATGYAALSEACDEAMERHMVALDAVEVAFPGDLSELLHKLEILALYHSEDVFGFPSMLDLAARDLWHLGARHDLSDESARLNRDWRPFEDSPGWDDDRSKATWRYIEGRGVVAVVTP